MTACQIHCCKGFFRRYSNMETLIYSDKSHIIFYLKCSHEGHKRSNCKELELKSLYFVGTVLTLSAEWQKRTARIAKGGNPHHICFKWVVGLETFHLKNRLETIIKTLQLVCTWSIAWILCCPFLAIFKFLCDAPFMDVCRTRLLCYCGSGLQWAESFPLRIQHIGFNWCIVNLLF